MKKILLAVLILGHVTIACAQDKKGEYKVSRESVTATLQFLTSDGLKGRKPGTPEMETAAKYLEDIFVKNSVKPYFATYRDTLMNYPKPTSNVIGWIEGSDPNLKNEFVIISAHYDHVGLAKQAVNGDVIFNGADDNATGPLPKW
jgi:hypothetical protein